MVLILRLAACIMSALEMDDASGAVAFERARGLHHRSCVHSLAQIRLDPILGRGAGIGDACARSRRPPYATTRVFCHRDRLAAPVVQLARGRRVPTFSPIVVWTLFDDDRLAVVPYKTSECDLRVNDVSPRKLPWRLAGGPSTRGVGRLRQTA